MAKPASPKRQSATSAAQPNIGEPFNPYRRFNNVLIPEAMARSRELVPGAKIVYGRLRRYAGQDGECYPAVATLAAEVALCERQVQKHLRTLEAKKLLRCVRRYGNDGGQTSNVYQFLWHRMFDDVDDLDPIASGGANSSSPPQRTPVHSAGRTAVHPKRVSIKEGHLKEGNADELCIVDLGKMSLYSDHDDSSGDDE